MKRILIHGRRDLIACVLLVSACNGGNSGGGSETSGSNGAGDDGSSLECPSNQVRDLSGNCSCPQGLHLKGNYCIDWAESVQEGAEYLEVGYPLAVPLTGGSYISPLYMKVGNIDQDPELELVFKHGTSPIYAWNHDGSVVTGWPVNASTHNHGKHVLAQLDNDPQLEVFFGTEGSGVESDYCELNAFDGNGALLSGWPQRCGLSVYRAPVAVDLDQDGYDEIIYNDSTQLAYIDRFGTKHVISIPNSPSSKWCGVAVADMTVAPGKELALVNCSRPVLENGVSTNYLTLYLLSSQFEIQPGFPVSYPGTISDNPMIADVDGDGQKEIVVLGWGTHTDYDQRGVLTVYRIISGTGAIKEKIEFTEQVMGPAAVADIDQDGIPEILVRSALHPPSRIYAYKGSGTAVPGWPVVGGNFAVGDIDGDGVSEVVTFIDYDTPYINDDRNVLAIYTGSGVMKQRFHVTIDYMGNDAATIMPVIADIDLDGRNELIAIGDYWEGSSGEFPQVWAFDFRGPGPYGTVQWGQAFGDEKNTDEYALH